MPGLEHLEWLVMVLPTLLLSLTVHEYAHARTALAFGDTTAQGLGRVTLNPVAHLDPLGTLCMCLAGFGWAKPVPVNPANLNPRRSGDIAVSFAGPLSNLFLAALCIVALKLYWHYGTHLESLNATLADALWENIYFGAYANIGLAVFNMVPLFPLDGHHIARETLKSLERQQDFMDWQLRYGRGLLMALIVGPVLLPDGYPDWCDPLLYVRRLATDQVFGLCLPELGL
jgi:Zn-dependent protease